MANKWEVKELLSAVKMNSLGVPQYSDSEQIGIVDTGRLKGMTMYNTDHETLQVYQGGNGSVFSKTILSNYLFRDKTNLGIFTKKTVYDEHFVNTEGKMNTRVFVAMEYLQEISIAGEIEIIVTNGSSPVNASIGLISQVSPVKRYIEFELDTTSFSLDDVLRVQVNLTQVQVEFVEMRGI